VAQLRRAKSRFDDIGAQVVLVGMGTPEESTSFKEKFGVPFPIISDPEKQVYRAFDLKRLSPLGFFSPAVALKGISAMAQGHTMGLPQGDVRQLPGVFIINTDGQIVYRHYASDPSDHPDPDTILEAVEAST
jgi:peroxiredoxin